MWWAQLLNNIVSLLGNGGGATNSFESIATATVGSGGSSTITFSSIPSTYKHLQIRASVLCSSASGDSTIAFNGATSTYADHLLLGDGASAYASYDTAANQWAYLTQGTNSTSYPTVFVCDILDYANTNKNKVVRTLGGCDKNGSGGIGLVSGLWTTTTAVSSIVVKPAAGNYNQYSVIALYGVK